MRRPFLARGKVLVVDDSPDIVRGVRAYLEREGYEVIEAADGEQALVRVNRDAPDVLVLDVMMPGLDGFELCREIRKTRTIPILMLSARDDDVDKILGLELGADDYLTKPFNPKELVARVRAMFRRLGMVAKETREDVIERRDIRIDVGGQRVDVGGQRLDLTPIEFNLLRVLAAEAGRTVSRQDLLNRVWGPDYFGDERTVDTHIRNLRAKLQKATPGPHYIRSVWGVGYSFDA